MPKNKAQQPARFFNGVVGGSCGIKRTSLSLLGDVDSAQSFGQARVQTTFNAGNGNLFIQDHTTPLEALGFRCNIGMVYNSQDGSVGSPWRFNLTKKIADGFNPRETVSIEEEDGSVTAFQYDAAHDQYVATGLSEGRSILCQHQDNTWALYAPGTGIVTQFSAEGLQTSTTDRLGRICHFQYDTSQQLTQLVLPGNHVVSFTYANQTTTVSYQEGDGPVQLLKTYAFDSQRRLTTITIPLADGAHYDINYQYDSATGCLANVTQTDGTRMAFTYQNQGGAYCVDSIAVGDNPAYQIQYQEGLTRLSDPRGGVTEYAFTADDLGDLWLSRLSHSVDATTHDTLDFVYADSLLQHKAYSSGVVERRAYDANGLLLTATDGLGHQTETIRDLDSGLVISSVSYIHTGDATTTLVCRFVYNDRQQLIGEITSKGFVTIYGYDDQGNRISARGFLNVYFDASHYQPEQNVPLADLNAWCAAQDITQTRLIEFAYNDRGQCISEKHYVTLDAHGNGVFDDKARFIERTWDAYGNRLSENRRQNAAITARDIYQYDGLQRLVSHTDPMNQATRIVYSDVQQQIVTTLPNGLQRTIATDHAGLAHSKQETADGITRTTIYLRDAVGAVYDCQLPDQQHTYHIHDNRGRLIYAVDPLGYVTEYRYDDRNHLSDTIRYDVPLAHLDAINWQAISSTDFSHLVTVTPDKDRHETKLYDFANRLRYTIDGEDAVVEYQYDDANRAIAKIRYTQRLAPDVPRTLPDGSHLPVVTAPADRIHHFYRDKDSHIQGEQDAAGFVTENRLNSAGDIYAVIRYATATAIANTLDAARPAAVPAQDAHHLYFLDLLGQIIDEIDAEAYLTNYERLSNGFVSKKTRYARAVDPSTIHSIADIHPVVDPEDHVTTSDYDALNRPTDTTQVTAGIRTMTSYDTAGLVVYRAIADVRDPAQIRETRTRYNGWSQTTAVMDPRLSARYRQIDQDPSIPPDQKAQMLEALWTQSSSRRQYDASGLLLATQDQNSNKTLYYYTSARQLKYKIDPKGFVTENIYDAYGKPQQIRTYATPLTAVQLQPLTGGFVDAAIDRLIATLVDAAHDSIEAFAYDRRGLVVTTTDPEAHVTTKTYNVFRECERQIQTVDSTHQLVSTFDYEPRGCQIQVVQDAMGLAITTTKHFDYHMAVDRMTDANGNMHAYAHDRLGRQVNHTDPLHQTSAQAYDAFDRVLSQIDRSQATTTHTYRTTQRTHAVVTPEGRQTVLQQNAFGETIAKTDANQQIKRREYEPGGEVSASVDALGRRVEDDYDFTGFHTAHRDARTVASQYQADETGHVAIITDDTAVLKFVTAITKRDAHYLELERANTRQVKTLTARDRRGLVTTTIVDPKDAAINPQGLHMMTITTFDGLRHKTAVIKGDHDNPNQYEAHTIYDTAGRETDTIIDPRTEAHPDGLAITTSATLDKAGNKTTETDANGNVTHRFYNANHQEICLVDPEGSIAEMTRDPEGRLLATRRYQQILTAVQLAQLTPLSTAADVHAMIATDPNDRITLLRYDRDGKLKYKINYAGAVTEYLYDAAGRQIGQTCYATPIALAEIHDITAAEIARLITRTPGQDRISYAILDAVGQLCFEINALGYVTETRYDLSRNPVAEIHYQNPIDIARITQFTPAEITSLLVRPEESITHHNIYDRLNRRILHIDAGLFVTQYTYDADDNEVQYRKYINPLTQLPAVWDEAHILALLQRDDTHDRITRTTVDALGRKQIVQDACNHTDQYTYNIFNGITSHTDRLGYVWGYSFDRAGREYLQTSPALPLTTVTVDAGAPAFKLIAQDITTAIEKRIAFDAVGNAQQITEGANLPDARTLFMRYNAKRQLVLSTMAGVLVDDPTQTPSATTRPDRTMSVTKKTVFNAFQDSVVAQDEAGACEFTVYNPAGKIIYTVDAEGYVTAYQRNVFQEVTCITAYAKKLALDLTPYQATGLTETVIQGAIVPTAEEDRVIEIAYDLAGRKVQTTFKGAVHVVAMQDGVSHYTQAELQKTWGYNAIGDASVERTLVDPTTNTWSETRTFFDYNHKIVATIDPRGYVTIFLRNCDGNVIDEIQYANAIALDTIPATVDALRTLCEGNRSLQDRHKRYEYDQKGRLHKEITVNVVTQAAQLDTAGIPRLIDQPPKDLVRQTDYDALDQVIQITEADGAVHRFEYDAYGRNVAERLPPRATQDAEGHPVTYIETVQKSFNGYGQEVKKVRDVSIAGIDAETVVLDRDAEEAITQTTLSLVDNRGLPLAIQRDLDESRYTVRFLSYTAVKTEARRWQWVTGWSDQPVTQPVARASGLRAWFAAASASTADYVPVTRLYQRRTVYNLRHEKIATYLRQRDDSDQVTQLQMSAFGDITGIGPGDGTWPVENRYDTAGRLWYSTQQQGVPTVYFYDGANRETLSCRPGGRATAVDLRTFSYEQSAALVSMDYSQIAQTFTERDLSGNVIRQDLPKFKAIKQGAPEPIHTTFLVSRKFSTDFGVVSISWPEPANQFLVGTLRLWVKGHEDAVPIVLSAVRKNGRMGANITSLNTDYYTYELSYYSIDALTGVINDTMPVYRVRATDLPIDTGNTAQSQHAVVRKTGPAQLTITGKTQTVCGIALIKSGQVQTCVAVSLINNEYTADLNTAISGTYTAKFVRATANIDGPVPVGQPTASGHVMTIHHTTFTPNNDSGSEPDQDMYSMGTTIAWHDLPPGCHQLQGRFSSFNVNQFSPPDSYSARVSPYQPLVETFPASAGSHRFAYQNSGRNNFPGLRMELSALDQTGNTFYLGQATSTTAFPTSAVTAPYFYVVTQHNVIADAVALIDAAGITYAILALEPWMNGMRRACISTISNPAQYSYQLMSLSPIIDDTFETEPFDIQTEHDSTEIMSRELLLEPSYCDMITPEYPMNYLKPTIKISDARYARQYLHVSVNANTRVGAITKEIYLGYGIGTWALQGFPGPAAVVTHLRASIVLESGAEIPLIDSAVSSQSGNRYLFTGHVNYLSPIPTNTANVELWYFDNTLGRDSTWVQAGPADLHLVPGDGIALNTTALQSGVYNFRLKAWDASHNLIPLPNSASDGWYYGRLNINNSDGFIATPTQAIDYELLSPTILQVLDRWSNVVSQTNPRGFMTRKTFNHHDRLLVVDEPEIDVTTETGVLQPNVRTQTRYGYSETDAVVGTVDANGNTTVHFYNDAHEVVRTVVGDGVSQQLIRDGFGREVRTIDGLSHIKHKKHDRQDHEIAQRDAMGWQTTRTYNERHDMLSEANPVPEITRFDVDFSHNTVMTITPSKQTMRRQYDRNHQVLVADYGLQPAYQPLTSIRDYFGHLTSYSDLSGGTYDYGYDLAFRLTQVQQRPGTGNHGQYYNAAGVLVPVPPVSILYANNEAGVTEEIIDVNGDSRTALPLNISGRRIGERFFAFDGVEHQCTYVDLNSRDWPIRIWDIRMQATYAHDAYGNRRRTRVAYVWDADKPIPGIDDNWYTYSAANIIQIVKGRLVGGQITIARNNQGTQLYYAGHRRVGERTLDSTGNTVLKAISYYDNDLVKQIDTHLGDGGTTQEVMVYDRASRRQTYQKSGSDQNDVKKNYTENTVCDANGEIISQTHVDKSQESTTTFASRDAQGNPTHQITVTKVKDTKGTVVATITDTYDMQYLGFDQLQLSRVSGKRQDSQYPGTQSDVLSVYNTFDSLGWIRSIEGDTGPIGGRAFVRNSEGRIIYAQASKIFDAHQPTPAGLLREYELPDTEGHILGHVGNIPREARRIIGGIADPSCVDFDLNYHAITSSYPPPAPQQYVPVLGDSFASIAQQLFGDLTFASDIAEANGFNQNDQPPVGRRLIIPQSLYVSAHNWEGIYPVYDESRLIGSYYPYLPAVQIQPKNKFNFLELLIEIFIEVLVFYFQPELAGVFNIFKSTSWIALFASNAMAGAVLAADVDILQQLTAMGFGDQKEFSANHLLKAILNQAELAGVGGALHINPNELRNSLDFFKTLGKTAALVSITQLLRLATSQQKHLSWQDLVATLLINGSNVGINRGLVELREGPVKELALAVLRVGVTEIIDNAIYRQQFNIGVYAATMLGTFAGTIAAQPLEARIHEREQAKEQELAEARIKKAYQAEITDLLRANMKQFIETQYPTIDPEIQVREYFALLTGDSSYLNANPLEDGQKSSIRASQNAAAMFSRKPLQTTTPKSLAYQQRQMQHAVVDAQAARNQQMCIIDWDSPEIRGFIGPDDSATSGKQSRFLTRFGVFNGADEGESASPIEWTHIGLGVGAIGTGIGEYANKINGYWRGSNGKWYDIDWGGNQYTDGRNAVVERAEFFRGIGRFVFYADAAIELTQGWSDFKQHDYVGVTKSGLDIGMAAVGMYGGPLGFLVSSSYFVIDTTIGWGNVAREMERVDEINERIMGRSPWAGPKI